MSLLAPALNKTSTKLRKIKDPINYTNYILVKFCCYLQRNLNLNLI